MKYRLAIALLATVLLVGGTDLTPQTEAKFGTSCHFALAQYAIAQSNYGACVAVYGPTPPNTSSHPCWSQFQSFVHAQNLVAASCQINDPGN